MQKTWVKKFDKNVDSKTVDGYVPVGGVDTSSRN